MDATETQASGALEALFDVVNAFIDGAQMEALGSFEVAEFADEMEEILQRLDERRHVDEDLPDLKEYEDEAGRSAGAAP